MMFGSDVGALLWRGMGGRTENLAFILCPGQTDGVTGRSRTQKCRRAYRTIEGPV